MQACLQFPSGAKNHERSFRLVYISGVNSNHKSYQNNYL
jgi:hypothetical protein